MNEPTEPPAVRDEPAAGVAAVCGVPAAGVAAVRDEPAAGVAAVCDEPAAEVGCCGSAGRCGLSGLRRGSGPRPTVTVAEETPIPSAGALPEPPASTWPPAMAAAGRVEWLVAETVWWGGRLRSGVALRVAPDGRVRPVPAELAPDGDDTRRFPGTLLPGLVDAHVHSALVDLGTVRAGGIAEVWDLGGVPEKVAALAERALASGAGRALAAGAELPRIRFAGPFLIAPGGYPSDRAWAPEGSWREIRSVAGAAEAVAAARTAGATLIKVTAHAGGPMLEPATLAALVAAARAVELPVVVHAEGAGTVAAAVAAGAAMLAHTPWTERIDDALLKVCAERMTWISTLDIHGWGEPDPAAEVAVGNLRRFLEFGGSVRYGTDLGNGPLPPGVNPREIRLLLSAGLTPDGVLTAMTETGSSTICWVPGGLDLAALPDSLATARVVGPGVRPAIH
ncbi:amidohydrolase family protein [Actinoplanes sp. NPDC049802]|uniref:amidohydrolase family protein n=1 Tax=Actinoplanes sp. NPDC049802 TaxID=3154742 RepID=UPI0033CAE2F3